MKNITVDEYHDGFRIFWDRHSLADNEGISYHLQVQVYNVYTCTCLYPTLFILLLCFSFLLILLPLPPFVTPLCTQPLSPCQLPPTTLAHLHGFFSTFTLPPFANCLDPSLSLLSNQPLSLTPSPPTTSSLPTTHPSIPFHFLLSLCST